MSNEEFYLELVGKIGSIERRLSDMPVIETGWNPVFLAEPLTSTDFDGDSFSDVVAHTKIENTSWSSVVPSNALALSLLIQSRDSGSAGGNCYIAIYSTATATNPAMVHYLYGAPNDAIWASAAIVPCTDGDIWYKCEATGTNTLDIWLYVTGYWVP